MNLRHSTAATDNMPIRLWDASYAALMECLPQAKCDSVRALNAAWLRGEVALAGESEIAVFSSPGRPERPLLVSPQKVPRRSMATPKGRASLIHALTHIEFNAINLALDAVYRFRDMPLAYYGEWLKVAAEECLHFALLQNHLRTLGWEYGDFPAHDGLWEVAVRTSGDVLERMALVPRLLEARGLDVTPAMREKLKDAGDYPAAAILDVILSDEIGHVAIGNGWFHALCSQRGLLPNLVFLDLLERHGVAGPKPPFNMVARKAAGFSEEELAWLQGRLQGIAQQPE